MRRSENLLAFDHVFVSTAKIPFFDQDHMVDIEFMPTTSCKITTAPMSLEDIELLCNNSLAIPALTLAGAESFWKAR